MSDLSALASATVSSLGPPMIGPVWDMADPDAPRPSEVIGNIALHAVWRRDRDGSSRFGSALSLAVDKDTQALYAWPERGHCLPLTFAGGPSSAVIEDTLRTLVAGFAPLGASITDWWSRQYEGQVFTARMAAALDLSATPRTATDLSFEAGAGVEGLGDLRVWYRFGAQEPDLMEGSAPDLATDPWPDLLERFSARYDRVMARFVADGCLALAGAEQAWYEVSW
jgi:hypothetical protein